MDEERITSNPDEVELNPLQIEDLYACFRAADNVLLKKYLLQLGNSACVAPLDSVMQIPVGENVSLYEICSIVYDTEENTQEKLTTVYSSLLPAMQSSVLLLLKGEKDRAKLYLGVTNHAGYPTEEGTYECFDRDLLVDSANTVRGAFEGNFPGSVLSVVPSKDVINKEDKRKSKVSKKTLITNAILTSKFVASVSSIPAMRTENGVDHESFVQGLEKLIDTLRGREYTMLVLADPIGIEKINSICANYEDIYGQLSPFAQTQQQFNSSVGDTKTEGFIKGVTKTTNESVSKSLSHGVTDSVSRTHTGGGSAGVNVGIAQASANYSYARGKTKSTSDTTTDSSTTGTAESLSDQNSVSSALTSSAGESITLTFENRAVKTLLDRIDEQIERLRSCEDFGMFDACAYFLAKDLDTILMASGVFKSLTRGEKSSVESSAVNVWRDEENVKNIKEYLSRFLHPLFCHVIDDEHDYPVTPAMLISGRELAYEMTLPKKSVLGLPVICCAAFGRNVVSKDKGYAGNIELGSIYHMQKVEEKVPVKLTAKDLTMHTFVTGSTGSGKSNTVYQLIDQVTKVGAKFLVVEPAKGEYKHVFGRVPGLNVSVYGTNPNISKMLRINPFSFPDEIHIYEHMDRLIEIFNVCWPMYAAMPAVLKDAIERAYIGAGWNLKTSKNRHDLKIYPTFGDVLRQIDVVMEESQYSSESKGDYKGALSTRLKSLTNGINGMIFTSDELSAEELFEENVIVDLSRVGSTETKALIMGLLVMKLQEHRMALGQMNAELNHVTVLEEAHNLLKRTSTEQSAEGSNLVGKSVEMITNAIAEMRTYGEGFIIVDQAPGLLDMAAVRNTNTKIILRLPEYSDRELVGKACGLTEDQIDELARFEKGVAAVYQNDWVEAVLCKVKHYKSDETPFSEKASVIDQTYLVKSTIFDAIIRNKLHEKIEWIDRMMLSTDLPAQLKCSILEYKGKNLRDFAAISKIAYDLFEAEKVFAKLPKEMSKISDYLKSTLEPSVQSLRDVEVQRVALMLIEEQIRRHPEQQEQLRPLRGRNARL